MDIIEIVRAYKLVKSRAGVLMFYMDMNDIDLNEEGNRLFRELEAAIAAVEKD